MRRFTTPLVKGLSSTPWRTWYRIPCSSIITNWNNKETQPARYDTHTHTHTDRQTHTHRHTHIHTHIHTYTHTHIHTHMHTHRHTHTHTHTHRDTHTHRHTHTGRHTHTQTDTHTYTHTATHRQTDTHTDRHRQLLSVGWVITTWCAREFRDIYTQASVRMSITALYTVFITLWIFKLYIFDFKFFM